MKLSVLVVTLHLFLILPGIALSAQKSVIVGFTHEPGPAEKALIRGARGHIKRSYRLIPAMAASLPEEEIEKLRENPDVAYVEEAAVYRAPVEQQGNGSQSGGPRYGY
jgi:subtilisin